MTTPDITLDTAKQHLRILHNDFDADIQSKLDQANGIVWDYIKKQPDGSDGWAPTAGQLGIVETATMMVLSQLYDDRNIGESDNPSIAMGYLTPQVTAILHRLRHPAVA